MATKAKSKGMLGDIISTFGTNLIGVPLAFIFTFFSAKYISPDARGAVTMYQLVGNTLLTLLTFSLTSGIIYYTSKFQYKNVKKSIMQLTLLCLGAILFVGLATAFILKDNYFKETPFIFVLLAIAYAMFSFVSSVFLCILRGENKFTEYNMIVLIQKVLVTVLVIPIIILPDPMVIVFTGLFTITVSIVICIVIIKKLPTNDDGEKNEIVTKATLFKYSAKAYSSNLLTFVNTMVSQYILGESSLANLSFYSFAYALVEQLWLLPNAVSMVVLSRLAQMSESDGREKITILSCKIVTWITLVCAVLLMVAADLFVPIVFPQYIGSIAPLKILVIGSYFISYAKVLGNSVAGYGKPELNIIPTALGLSVNTVLGFTMIPIFGIIGAAIATSVSLTIQGIAVTIIFCRHTNTPIYKLVVPTAQDIILIKSVLPKRGGKK